MKNYVNIITLIYTLRETIHLFDLWIVTARLSYFFQSCNK